MSGDATTWPVELYVYDLSGGLARQLSGTLLGRQFDAVYHTSIVVHSREYFFGRGISVTAPGGSHHGQPMEKIPLGNTEIDAETWTALVDDLRGRFSAAAYSLMDFNCNTFSNECSQILVGREIPAHILSLPSDFQSALGGLMAGRSPAASGGTAAGPAGPSPLLGLMNQFERRGRGEADAADITPGLSDSLQTVPAPPPVDSSNSKPANLVNVTQAAELDRVLNRWPCAAVLFTNTRTCPPCKVIHPVFEALAKEYSPTSSKGDGRKIAFVVVDSTPASAALMAAQNIRGTPTFKFFSAGKPRHSFSGADANELRSQVEITLFDVYQLHPHTQLKPALQSLREIPREPIVAAAVPNLASALRTLDESISSVRASDFKAKADLQDARKTIAKQVIPWLEAHFTSVQSSQSVKKPLSLGLAVSWQQAAKTLGAQLPPAAIFPLVDMLRLALTDFESASIASQAGVVGEVIEAVTSALGSNTKDNLRPVRLTSLKMLGNLGRLCLSGQPAAGAAASSSDPAFGPTTSFSSTLSDHRTAVLDDWIIGGLSHSDKAVRNAAASTAFNFALWRATDRSQYRVRPEQAENGEAHFTSSSSGALGQDFEIDLLPALLEAVKKEEESADVLHRVSAALLLLLYLSTQSEELAELLQILEAREILQGKVNADIVKTAEKCSSITAICKDLVRLVGAETSPQ